MLALRCPCGLQISGSDEEELIARVNDHLTRRHPQQAGAYTREDITALAYRLPDSSL
ncbi:DUF1059 domain-containing protein [Conexibacter stalactiti]|uniref:DUF1059 domain-containing protein n=1 Tax=Conexibacter stalactiti TaxID=1940611 RepID=A0ABU4HI93_9ACTN|nr:DUF1059 domain-containing protein [Conexibacter stalactiti]MDW5593035.1 DUF1059 domain-containing protein [Conexibacter stalactiti]MEC5033676.1 DUF1059 domain-containing protein [Conexibacter stalactiti]